MLEVGAGRRERCAADAAVPVALVFVVRSNRNRGGVALLMGDAAREQRAAARLRRHVLHRPCQSGREDERLLIVDLVVPRQQIGRFPAVADRPAIHALDNVLPLRRLRCRKRVLRVKSGVAPDRIEFTVILLRARLRQDLDSAASRPRVLRRIRVLVDFDLLDGRR